MPTPRNYFLRRDDPAEERDPNSLGSIARRRSRGNESEMDRRVRAIAERERRNNEVTVRWVEPGSLR